MKQLIVNGDDFGLDRSIDDAIEKAHRKGILTSASLAVSGNDFDHAVDIAKRNKGLGVGIHLTLNGEKPVAPAEDIRSMLETDGGRLIEDHGRTCRDIIMGKIDPGHLATEVEAQLEKFHRSGLLPTHLDSHRHVHLFPPIFNVIKPVIKKYGIRKIRWINVPWYDYRFASLNKLGFLLVSKLTRYNIPSYYRRTNYFLGFFKSGSIDTDYLKDILPRLTRGVTEINIHPGLDNASLYGKYGIWQKNYGWECNWEKEYRVLVDTDIKRLINDRNIKLIHYGCI